MKLQTRLVEKPWGRTELPPMFAPAAGRCIGEVWFEATDGDADANLPLLAKYIFTSERLSIQVHPDDAAAHARGLDGGKSECWYILDTQPGATLGLGLTESVGAEELRSAALNGSIEQLIDWRPVRRGDFFYVPAGTIHAIGPGIALLEFQQNNDVTYRLYDYGRPRELHLDEAMAVARPGPYADELWRNVPNAPEVLLDGPHFSLVQGVDGKAPAEALAGRRRWVMPLEGQVTAGDEQASAGECLLLDESVGLDFSSARVMIGAEGPISASAAY